MNESHYPIVPLAAPRTWDYHTAVRADHRSSLWILGSLRGFSASLGTGTGLIPTILHKAQNKNQNPAKLRRLIDHIDGETWIGLGIDVKGHK